MLLRSQPSVTGPTCDAPGSLSITATPGVTYTVTPAYTAGASGTFTIDAVADEGFVLTGDTSFTVDVPAREDGVRRRDAGRQPATPPSSHRFPTPPWSFPASSQAPLLVAILGIGGLAVLAGSNLVAASKRR